MGHPGDVGEDCDRNSDCKSSICGRPGLEDDDTCWVRGSSCACATTEAPTSLPSLTPSHLPTSAPTHSPPVAISVSLKGSTGNFSLGEVNPTSKLSLESDWLSPDPETSFAWDVLALDDDLESPSLVYGVTTATAPTNEFLVLKARVLEGGVG